ncbi:hypothetical protein OIDMADRAFT_135324 [Oidiodendron maius Zn]|uniref:Fatty acid hydroxylase domain-containing protein n=1 Tax=Oidiodendron maius (strain Zn) TaxID=913774 RepID=A0A0C3C702_OIDMZ|nr:hypothetical protein OIDMADRAFT_135324 [Oidiodendron maius Zn]
MLLTYALVRVEEITWDDLFLQAVVPAAAYWIYSSLFALIDAKDFFPQYRIFPLNGRLNPVSESQVVRNVLKQQFCQFALSLIIAHFEHPCGTDAPQLQVQMHSSTDKTVLFASSHIIHFAWIMTIVRLALRILAAMIIYDTWYFWAHYLVHKNSWLYKNLHAHHHQLYRPKAYGASFNALAETLILETAGAFIASRISGLTSRDTIFFFTFSTLKGCDDHSGYNIPWNPISLWGRITGADVLHHSIHHQAWGMKYNQAFFFPFWEIILQCNYTGPRNPSSNKRPYKNKYY